MPVRDRPARRPGGHRQDHRHRPGNRACAVRPTELGLQDNDSPEQERRRRRTRQQDRSDRLGALGPRSRIPSRTLGRGGRLTARAGASSDPGTGGTHHRLLRRSRSDGKTGQTVVGTARPGRGTQSACKRSRRQPAEPIRDSELVSQPKSECTGAISSFKPSRTESLANRGRPCTSGDPVLNLRGGDRSLVST